jgi:hypothetical protein
MCGWQQGPHSISPRACPDVAASNPIPPSLYVTPTCGRPMLVSATLAAVVASQALITGSFSIIRQVSARGSDHYATGQGSPTTRLDRGAQIRG